MATLNLATGANFNFLNVELVAMFERTGQGIKVLVCPTTVEEPKTAYLNDIVNDFKRMFQDEEVKGKIENELNNLVPQTNDFSNIGFKLNTVFLYADMPSEQPTVTVGDNKTTGEYALAVSVELPDLDFGFIKFNSVFFAIWNTERKKILETMNFGSIEDMLKKLDA